MNGLLPKPRCILYTSLACDANLLTFPRLAAYYQVPSFCIDVPTDVSEDAVAYVRDELVKARQFLCETTGRPIEEDALKARVKRSRESLLAYEQVQRDRADRFVPADLVTPLYSAMTANILLGTPEEARYVRMLQEDLRSAPAKRGKHIYWMHTIPFWSDAVKKYFLFQDSAQIVACELAQACSPDFDTGDPMLGMAQRLVRNAINGPAERRIANGIRHARDARADGVIWFNHWGCKHTLGVSRLAKQAFEDAGFPTLLLDGDGCDRAHGGEGQTPLELLEGLGAHTKAWNDMPAGFGRSEQLLGSNICGFGKALLDACLSGQIHELVLTSCCDTIRSLADVLRAEDTLDFLYLLDVPHREDDCSVDRFARELRRLMEAYETSEIQRSGGGERTARGLFRRSRADLRTISQRTRRTDGRTALRPDRRSHATSPGESHLRRRPDAPRRIPVRTAGYRFSG